MIYMLLKLSAHNHSKILGVDVGSATSSLEKVIKVYEKFLPKQLLS